MILKNKIILGVSATIAGATAVGLGLGLGLGLETSVSVARSSRETAVNTAKDLLDISFTDAPDPSKPDVKQSFFQSGFGNSISFTNIPNSDVYFTVNLARILVKDADLYDIGLGFGVFAIERTNEVLPNSDFAYDNFNTVVVIDSEVGAFKTKYPEAREVTSTIKGLGYKEFALPMLDKNGAPLKRDSETAKIYFVDPISGTKTEIPSTRSTVGGAITYRPTTIDTSLALKVRKALFYQLYKLAVIADESLGRIAFVNIATDAGQIVDKQLFTFEEISKTGVGTLVSIAGRSKEAIKTLLSDANGALSFQRQAQDSQLFTTEQIADLSDSELANIYSFDSNGVATFTENGKTSTYELTTAQIGKYAGVKITSYVRSSQNIVYLNASEIKAITDLFDEVAIEKMKLVSAIHEADKVVYLAGEVPVITKRTYRNWSQLLSLGESVVRLQAVEEGKQFVDVLFNNRVKAGFVYPGAMYGFVPKIVGSYFDGKDKIVNLVDGVRLSINSRETYASFLLNAYKQDNALANSTIISKLKLNTLFKKLSPTGAQEDSEQLDKFSNANPIVHTLANEDGDVSVYYKMFTNYQDANGAAQQKAFSKDDWKQALFGSTTATDVELLRYLFLQAKITDIGYEQDYLDINTNTVKKLQANRYVKPATFTNGKRDVELHDQHSFSVIRIALPAAQNEIQTLIATNTKISPDDVAYDNGFLHILNNAVEVLKTLFLSPSFKLANFFGVASDTVTTNPFVFTQTDIDAAITAVNATDYPQFKRVVFPEVKPKFVENVGTQIFAPLSVGLNGKLVSAFEQFISKTPSYTKFNRIKDPNDSTKSLDQAATVNLKTTYDANTQVLSDTKTIAVKYPALAGSTFNVYSLSLDTTPLKDRLAAGTTFAVGATPKLGAISTLGTSTNLLNGVLQDRINLTLAFNSFLALTLDKTSTIAGSNFLVLSNWVDGAKKVKTTDGREIDPDQFESYRNVMRMFAILDELKIQIKITMRDGAAGNVTNEIIDQYFGANNWEVVAQSSSTLARPIVSLKLGKYVDSLVSAYKVQYPNFDPTAFNLDQEATKVKTEVATFISSL